MSYLGSDGSTRILLDLLVRPDDGRIKVVAWGYSGPEVQVVQTGWTSSGQRVFNVAVGSATGTLTASSPPVFESTQIQSALLAWQQQHPASLVAMQELSWFASAPPATLLRYTQCDVPDWCLEVNGAVGCAAALAGLASILAFTPAACGTGMGCAGAVLGITSSILWSIDNCQGVLPPPPANDCEFCKGKPLCDCFCIPCGFFGTGAKE